MANESIKLDLSLPEINVILASLGEMPAKQTIGVINKLQMQAGPQVVPEPVPDEEAAEE